MDHGRAQVVMIAWKKLGLIFQPRIEAYWMRSHAQLPTPVMLDGGRCRVFFAGRDGRQRSHAGWFDVHLDDPAQILETSPDPVLTPGKPGFFDGDGIYVASAVRTNADKLQLYTIGWNAGSKPPMFYAGIGVAESLDGGRTCRKLGQAPIMGRSEHDPCLVTAPVVLRDAGEWKMWYVSGIEWEKTETGLQSHYHIKYAHSADGLAWERAGQVCVACNAPDETNISRFWVLREGRIYHAWYGYHRGAGYRIGYATSLDGLAWQRRDDEAGIEVSASGWDSEAIAYPAVVRYNGRLFMFYNGNGFGRDGIGLAIADNLDVV